MTELGLSGELGAHRFRVELRQARCLAWGLDFAKGQTGAFGLPPATATAVDSGGFVGDPARGGSCRCDTLTMIPHAHGTHTEGVGHLSTIHLSLHQSLTDVLIPATLVTPDFTGESLSAGHLAAALAPFPEEWRQAVVLRLAPAEKAPIDWTGRARPHVGPDATAWLRQQGCRHLVTDLPSLDPEWDGGALAAHRAFWNLGPEEQPLTPAPETITELAMIPADLKDGPGLLNMQIAPFDRDAAPSRPVWLPITLQPAT